ncbi:hypothetical protein CAM18_24110 [Salmonella enterica]|nr:hypothetical protein [Salmonella enterica]ECO1003893.1 hypothetical protein [Salmonella enterica subsp. enterica serovar Give]ECS8314558.1 hypothetical protein [Salmonella enterica subsp. enterica serovar Panama]ECT7813474.1 hypothetical protein [Salmonella enterica subsp. enterica serovar 9,12:-:1,5]EDR7365554.1 hypothetical protein [Salmonella enterica subsp. enterica serovar Oslo]
MYYCGNDLIVLHTEPLLVAFHLTETDNVFSGNCYVTYARYMDDFLILSPTWWHLRRTVRMLNRYFAQAGFEQHPDKTFIGRVEKGFDWMGFWFTDKGGATASHPVHYNILRTDSAGFMSGSGCGLKTPGTAG